MLPQIDSLAPVLALVLDGRRHADRLVVDGHEHGLGKAVALHVGPGADVLAGGTLANLLEDKALLVDDFSARLMTAASAWVRRMRLSCPVSSS